MFFTFLVAALVATAVTTTVTSALTAGGRADDAQTRKEAAEANAALALKRAQGVQTQTADDILSRRDKGVRELKTQRAAMGFAGVDITKGSALEIRSKSAATIEADVGRIQRQGDFDYNALMQDYNTYTAAAALEDTSWGSNFLSGL